MRPPTRSSRALARRRAASAARLRTVRASSDAARRTAPLRRAGARATARDRSWPQSLRSRTMDRRMNELADEAYCYLTTTGRVSGEPREIEIWFGLQGQTLYMLSGGRDRSDWVKNLMREPRVSVRIAGRTFEADARVVEDPDEDARARALLFE